MRSQPTADHNETALDATRQQLNASFAQSNAAAVASFYSEDGQLLPTGSAAISGREAIQAFWQGCLDMGIGFLERQPAEVDLLGATANEVGSYRLYRRKGRVVDIGKYMIIWKKQHRKWKIHREIWTSSLSRTG